MHHTICGAKKIVVQPKINRFVSLIASRSLRGDNDQLSASKRIGCLESDCLQCLNRRRGYGAHDYH